MIKHKVKYRVVGADRAKRKYSINLDEGTSFHLTRELLQGAPAQEGSKPLCSFVVQSGALWVHAGTEQSDVSLNGKPVRECEVRPGDFTQVGEFSIEILECPHAVRNETNATQFLDVSEMFSSATKTTQTPVAASEPAHAHTQAQVHAPAPEAAAEAIAPESNAIETPLATDSDISRLHELPALNNSHQETRSVELQLQAPRDHEEAPHRPSGIRPRSSSYRDSEHPPTDRYSTNRHHKRAEEKFRHRQKENKKESKSAAFSESDFSHLAMSAGMAALGVAATTRVLVSGSSSPQGIVVACAALSSVPVMLGMSFGLSRMNKFLSTDSPLRDYARFLGWTLICAVPWAYTQGASLPIAIFTTLLTTVLISVAFIARFRPHIARFSGVGAGLSAFSLIVLITHHHFASDKNPAQESLSTEPSSLADSSTATAPIAANAPSASAPVAPSPAAGTVTTVQNTTANSPQPLQPQGGVPLAQQATAPAIPSAVNDSIPPIPNHLEAPAAANASGRTPANVDPSAKGIIDPLAHEEFFSAIKAGNLEVVKSLIDRKQVDADFTLDKGNTPLIVAAANGRLKVVEDLLRRRVSTNAQDPHGTTALMWAVFKGHRDVAKFLVSKGADTKVIRDDGDTAMDIARKWRRTEIVALLKDASQDDNVTSKKSRSSHKRHRR